MIAVERLARYQKIMHILPAARREVGDMANVDRVNNLDWQDYILLPFFRVRRKNNCVRAWAW